MRKIFMITILFILALASCSTIRYKSKKFDGLIVLDSSYYNKPKPIEIISKDSATGYTIVRSLSQDSVLQSIESFDNEKDRNFIGESKYYHSNGKLKKVEYYQNKNLYSSVKTYYQNGQLKRDDIFNDRVFVSGTCFDSLGNEAFHTDYQVNPSVDIESLQNCLVYPENMLTLNREEIVSFRILLTKEGKIAIIKYQKDNSAEFIEAALNCALKLSAKTFKYFKPGIIDDEPEDSWIEIPVRFSLR